MARAKSENNGTTAANKAGHNSQLTDAERRALTLHHKRHYEAADALVEKAKADRKAVAELAKSDLGKGAMSDIKDLIRLGDEKVIKAEIERQMRLARWMGLPVGQQLAMFDFMPDDKAAEEGRSAGMAGLECKPPSHWPASAHQRWIESWHDGQAILASAFAKKREKQDDASEPPPPSAGAEESQAQGRPH